MPKKNNPIEIPQELPPGERKRAQIVAEHLSPADREEFFRELQACADTIRPELEEQNSRMDRLLHMAGEMEANVRKTERAFDEERQQAADMTTVEERMEKSEDGAIQQSFSTAL
ncbi:MAG: hypothetical protein PHW10_00060 [Candidatus Peribacteraceae bacterium]|nr:hypothetical protein [Candidatus Peribacteraceae bacterium]